MGNPNEIIGPADRIVSNVTGPALAGNYLPFTENFETSLAITARDSSGYVRPTGTDNFVVTLSPNTLSITRSTFNNGSYVFSFNPTRGTHVNITITLNGAQMPNSPYRVLFPGMIYNTLKFVYSLRFP